MPQAQLTIWKEGRRKYYFVRADVIDWKTWPFPSDAFPIHRGKSRNKKFKEGDRVAFQAVEKNGDIKAWKISLIRVLKAIRTKLQY